MKGSGSNGFGRRTFLARLAASGALPAVLSRCGGEAARVGLSEGPVILSARGARTDTFGLAAVDAADAVVRVSSGFRGHDVTLHPGRSSEALLFGRRPGFESIAVDLRSGEVTARLQAAAGRSFQGHGVFDPDGSTLFTSEADLETAQGKIGVWDGTTYERLTEIDTAGLGPHEILFLPGSGLVAVANGGLLTRPETGRQVLNLDTMDSSLVYLEPESGRVAEQVRVSAPKASIRHMDIAADETVVFGLQVQREALDHDHIVPLMGDHRLGGVPRLFEDSPEVVALFRDYVGSVAVSAWYGVAGFTSPRGDVAGFWSVADGRFSGVVEFADVSGIDAMPDGDRFVLSNSRGEFRMVDAQTLEEQPDQRRRFDGMRWDNHLLVSDWPLERRT